jgi:hypothetical protein
MQLARTGAADGATGCASTRKQALESMYIKANKRKPLRTAKSLKKLPEITYNEKNVAESLLYGRVF